MNKKIVKILTIAIIISILLFNVTYGFTIDDLKGDTSKMGDVRTVGASAISIIAIIGSAVAVISLIILGIKYMSGSVEERATYKKTLIPYVIGAILVFGGATLIAQMIYSTFNKS